MVTYYLDSSSLIKRYVVETGSAWVKDLSDLSAENILLTSRLTVVETRSALARRRREASISLTDHASALRTFQTHCLTKYDFVEFESPIVELAGDLVENYVLRAYDAVQVASAISVHRNLVTARLPGLIFLAADDRILKVAQAEGMLTDNPNGHI